MLNLNKLRKEKTISELIQFGIINIDKPTGPTSFSVSHFVKNSLNIGKTSHLGTLDPMVTGVLPVALGRACRLNDYLMHKEKEYIGIMRLHEDVKPEILNSAIKKFIGKITQLPPVKSRVKRQERIREIISFEIIERDGKDVLFKTLVQAGTYIRKLIHDLGLEIGGAHMLELRRTKAAIFSEDSIISLYDFEKALVEYKNGNPEPLKNMIFPAEWAVQQVMPSVQVKKESLKKLLTGKPLMKSDVETKIPDSEIFAVFHKEKLIEIAKSSNEGDIIARPLFVLN